MSELADNFVVFSPSSLRVLKWSLPEPFQHCFIVRNDFDKVWTVIEDTPSRLEVHNFLVEDHPTPVSFAKPGSICIPAKRKEAKLYRGGPALFTCVEVCKAYLGIRAPFIVTPKQLYRYLLCQAQ